MNQFSLKLNNVNPGDYAFSLQDTNNFFYKRLEHFIVVRFSNHKKNFKILYLINYKLINKLIKFNVFNYI